MLCALIMAGGKGTRFWPLSTEEKPKQFLNLIGNETMIQMTINRIKPIIPIERIFVCTCEMYVDLVKEQLPELPNRNIIVEPEGRNTAPCIALSAIVIQRYYKDTNMIVLPSDHLINDEDEFRCIIEASNEFITNNRDAIITLGMNPTRPETGYGYIKYGSETEKINGHRIINVEAFVEKPNKEKAQEYVRQGCYLWNGGMFMWSTENIINQIKKYSENTYEALSNIEVIEEDKLQQCIDKNYCETESISIDYAVLEKAKEIYVIPSNIGWDDIGSWEAIERYRERDNHGNIRIGNINCVNGENNLVVATNQKVIIDDLSNIYVIENDGHILLGKKDKISRVRSLKHA